MGSWIYILLYTIESTKRVDPLLIRAARNLGASDLHVMLHVILPGALPGIIAGLKVTLAISWSCVLSAEMIAAQNGLGALIWQGKDWGNLALVLVGMLCISIIVLLADKLAEHARAPAAAVGTASQKLMADAADPRGAQRHQGVHDRQGPGAGGGRRPLARDRARASSSACSAPPAAASRPS